MTHVADCLRNVFSSPTPDLIATLPLLATQVERMECQIDSGFPPPQTPRCPEIQAQVMSPGEALYAIHNRKSGLRVRAFKDLHSYERRALELDAQAQLDTAAELRLLMAPPIDNSMTWWIAPPPTQGTAFAAPRRPWWKFWT